MEGTLPLVFGGYGWQTRGARLPFQLEAPATVQVASIFRTLAARGNALASKSAGKPIPGERSSPVTSKYPAFF